MLPAGVGVVPLCLDVRRGAVDKFRAAPLRGAPE
jgi:hypothetical protein